MSGGFHAEGVGERRLGAGDQLGEGGAAGLSAGAVIPTTARLATPGKPRVPLRNRSTLVQGMVRLWPRVAMVKPVASRVNVSRRSTGRGRCRGRRRR